MSLHQANLPNLVIDNAGTSSNTITRSLDDARTVSILAPDALTGTVTIEVSHDGTVFQDLTSGGSDVTIGAGNSVTITDWAYQGLRLTSGTTEGATRTFTVKKTFEVGR